MRISRRDALTQLGGMAASLAVSPLLSDGASVPAMSGTDFPRKADFTMAPGSTYINGAFTHPMPTVSAAAMQRWSAGRATVGGPPPPPRVDPRIAYARLINAKPSEVAFIPNTSVGENYVVEALGIHRFDGNVVTDALHFEGR